MSNATTSDNSNNSANERRIQVRNLALMRSINTLKLHIDIVQDRIRDISGALVKARDQLIKIDTDLQSLADETGVLKDDLQEIKRQQDLRNFYHHYYHSFSVEKGFVTVALICSDRLL